MLKFVVRRFLSGVVTLFLATIVIFVLVRLAPGDPIELMLGVPSDMPIVNTPAYEQKTAALRAELGLDQSYFHQYIAWMKRVCQLDLGTSIYSGRAVSAELLEKLPPTLSLAAAAMLIQLILGSAFGILSAVKKGKGIDHGIRLCCIALASVPGFVVGLSLLYVFSVRNQWYEINSGAGWSRLWLPAFTLAITCAPQLIRMVRAHMLEEFGKTYIVAAFSRGLTIKHIVKHAIRNILLPITTLVALTFANLIGGAIVIENIFAWPGVGNYAMNSVLRHDYPVIQGYTFMMVILVLTLNILVDYVYMALNPQLHRKGGNL